MADVLRMTNISKAFFGVTVLDHVNFDVRRGEVHALLGENGAGKSTLMNILAGVYARDGGTVEFNGKRLDHATVQSTESAGIAFVHQELNLFNDLKVYENIFLRKELLNPLGFLDKKAMVRKTHELFESLGVDIDPTAPVSELETSKKQLLEIAKALFASAELLILDEPTTALNNTEIEHLFAIVRRLKAGGKSFIFISHKMNEVFTIADRYTVLRNGALIKTGDIADTTPHDVTRLMVGSKYSSEAYYEPRTLGEPILELRDFSGVGFQHIDLTIRRGEVIGFTGLKGAGISELMQTLFGVRPVLGGEIRIAGRVVSRHGVHQAMRAKVAMIAANRKENSVLPDMSLLENMYVSEHTLSLRRPVIRAKAEIGKYRALRATLGIKANDHTDAITSLSGGNQQKVILARWLNTQADILLMDNPTQGIDVGAKAEIYKLILELARAGKTILVNTLEIPEIQKMADRCIVFFHGGIQAVLDRSEITEENVMLCATNVVTAKEALQRHG
ncbi:MAG: sugar ABC transporter ATP-binding protein [Oscillospiraceae bacterium]|jgi:ribose transport system ATP-binding protein|nr:sugar ABC transporter ATP-binding protein [Oscillospiraceae bacterium]